MIFNNFSRPIFLALFVFLLIFTAFFAISGTIYAAGGKDGGQQKTDPAKADEKTKPAVQSTEETVDESGQSGFVFCGNTVKTPCNITHLFKTTVVIINYLISTAGLVAIFFIVIAGVQMVVSQGEGQLKSAKDKLSGAIIGLILVALAFVLVNSVFTGSLNIGVRCGSMVLTNPRAYINGCE